MATEYQEFSSDGERIVQIKRGGNIWSFQVLDDDHLDAKSDAAAFVTDEDGQLPDPVRRKLEAEGWEQIDLD
ncbi:hypothetical protein [Halostagnicola sp. A-GB9-2]|uniref:hypothetical protein n=1 Tax=Halostagnicola sp. A-GB9-2 TaxID=3048066 RepID=UPI0024BF8DBF|nr:hypothetical protein [Halostagnicola sp. A-GB9-2]MDJ1432277.1 hypothetical protein [Halostagnicola sp. A-GB9-2]